MNIITSVAKDKKGNITHVMLKSSSILTVADAMAIMEQFDFVTEDESGNQADIYLAKTSMRSKKNKIVSDNLDNLPLFEMAYE